jgi:hypothetical protein
MACSPIRAPGGCTGCASLLRRLVQRCVRGGDGRLASARQTRRSGRVDAAADPHRLRVKRSSGDSRRPRWHAAARGAPTAPSTRSAPTCSNSRNDRPPHVRLGSPRLRARDRPLSSVAQGADLGCWRYPAAVPSCLVDRPNPALLAYVLHVPPSAVPLVSDHRFRRSAQRLARMTL